MRIKDIIEIRILPAFAIGRLGSSSQPMDNYTWEIPDSVGFRKLVPAETLYVDQQTGKILSMTTPVEVRFRDEKNRIRPVAPFLEVWARFERKGNLFPLTMHHLKTLGLHPESLSWKVVVGNNKAFRRTRDDNDKILADTGLFTGFKRRSLNGRSANFLKGKKIHYGFGQYIRPTTQFPEIRFRFTPGGGFVYGPVIPRELQHDSGGMVINQRLIKEEVYDSKKGRWDHHSDDGRDSSLLTEPSLTYANDSSKNHRSLGYLDDGCDGIVEVVLQTKNKKLTAFSRIVAGPPAFAPDGTPVRTFADELEQALLGPEISGKANMEDIRDIVRRAMETVRLINTTIMNSEDGMAYMDNQAYSRELEPIMNINVVDNLAILSRHENVLLALESGSLAWFARLLRKYNEVGDLTDEGRRKMPALMRGADGSHLALTRRMVNKIIQAAETFPRPVNTLTWKQDGKNSSQSNSDK